MDSALIKLDLNSPFLERFLWEDLSLSDENLDLDRGMLCEQDQDSTRFCLDFKCIRLRLSRFSKALESFNLRLKLT